MHMDKIHEQVYLELDMVDDGEPVQVLQCRPEVVRRR